MTTPNTAQNVAQNVAIVTGGSTGIGWEICRQMLGAGYEVVSLARRPPPQSHTKLHAIEVDLMDAAATRQTAADVASRFAVTHVVHNAGVVRPALLPDVALDDLQALSQLHLGAAIALVQAALPAMKKNRFGRIVLMSSRGALGLATRTAYAATKAGMVGMARTWALELAGDGITVNVVAPGPISDTEMFRTIVPENSEREKALAAAIPVQRLGQSDDVARAVMFFCDRANGFVTGQTLYVCGGASLGTIVI
jgi:3-oxoacyl-[acyl-carrier protein] reductase